MPRPGFEPGSRPRKGRMLGRCTNGACFFKINPLFKSYPKLILYEPTRALVYANEPTKI